MREHEDAERHATGKANHLDLAGICRGAVRTFCVGDQSFHVGLPTCLTDIKPFQKGELITHSPTHYELHYVARMWKFEPEDVTVPAGSTVDIYLSAADVTHGLILLGTNLNLMSVPGVVNYARVKFDKPRVYQLLCHEFCGTGHDRMAAELHVVDMATFTARPSPPPALQPTHPGYKLLDANLCTTCHSIQINQTSIRFSNRSVFNTAGLQQSSPTQIS